MNKKLGVIIVIIVLLLLGGGAFVMSHKSTKSTAAQTATTTVNPTETAANKGTLGSLKSLMTSALPQTCTFSTQKQASTNGTIYVSGGKLRGDFTSTNQGQTINGHMLVDSGFSYIWTDLNKQGMKVAITEAQVNTAANSQAMDLNQDVSYSCKPWVADESKFTLPTDITFMTFTMPKAAATTGATTSGASIATGAVTSPCSACDSLPAAAQSVCRTQLHCN